MGRLAYLEVLDRRGRVRERIRVDGASPAVTIGRDYSNDVILDDRFVSPRHCRLVRDASGAFALEDLGSVNGIVMTTGSGGAGRHRLHAPLASGCRFRLGDTLLRFVEARHPVVEAEPMTHGHALRNLARPRLAVAIVLAAAAVVGLETYLANYYDLRFTKVAIEVLSGLGVLMIWAGAWAVANRFVSHRFEYRAHLAWASLITIAGSVVTVAVDYIWFLFSAERLATTLDYLATGMLFGVLLWGHLAVLPASTPRRRVSWALRSAFLFVVLSALFAYSDTTEFSTDVPVSVPLKPFGAEWAPATSLDDFLEATRATKDWVDQEREGERPR